MKKSKITLLLGLLSILATPNASAVTMGASSPEFTRLLYKGHPSMPTTPNSSIVNSAIGAGATFALNSVSGFKGAFTPVNVGLAVGTSLIAYGVSTALNELRIQAGANVPQYTNPSANIQMVNTDEYEVDWVAGNLGDGCAVSIHHSGTTSSVCSSINSQRNSWYSCANAGSPGVQITPAPLPNMGYCGVDGGGAAYVVLNHVGAPASCPAGYMPGGAGCTLISVSEVQYPSDGKPSYNIKFGGDGVPYLSPDPRDPDVAVDPPVLEQTGHDQYGNPASERVTANKQGGITVVRETQSEHPDTHTPMTQRDVLATDSFGTVTQATSTIYSTEITNVANDIDTSALAQESTLQQINNKLGEATAPDLANVDQPVTDARAAFIAGISGSQTTLDNNPAASVSPVAYWTYASGSCYPLEWDAGRFGKVSLSSFCSIYDTYIKPLEIWVLGVFGMLHAWQIWRTTVSVI